VPGPALNCNDTNPCTDDSCNPVSGCINAIRTGSCDDGLFCNGADICSAGVCYHSGPPCTPNCVEIGSPPYYYCL
jgi:hypothetical protein